MRHARKTAWLLLGLCSTLALAQDRPRDRGKDKDPGKDAKPVEIQIWAIRATTKNDRIDPELKALADKLRTFGKFTGFRLEAKRTGTAPLNKPFSAPLLGGYTAAVTPKSVDGAKVQLQVQINGKQPVNSTITLPAGQFQLWAFPLDGDEQLIVAVAAR